MKRKRCKEKIDECTYILILLLILLNIASTLLPGGVSELSFY